MNNAPIISLASDPTSRGLAISLSSSFFGFYTHAAFMRTLHEKGIFPERMAGTSAGAIVAGLCGTGMKGQELENFVMQAGLRRSFLDWAAPLRLPGVMSTFFFSGILSGKNFVKFLKARLPVSRLEDCQSPRVELAVTNLTHRCMKLVSKGDLAEWIMASCAVPGLFCNHVAEDARWCDGGVALETPFEQWMDDPEIHTILLHRIEHVRGTEFVPQWPSMASGFAASHATIGKVLHEMRMSRARECGKRVIEIVTETPHPTLFPRKVRQLLLETGRASGMRAAQLLQEEPAESRYCADFRSVAPASGLGVGSTVSVQKSACSVAL